MKFSSTLVILTTFSLGSFFCVAQTAAPAPPPAVSLDTWKSNVLPFSFTYDGKDSASFISLWQKTEEPATPSPGGKTYHYTYLDPATKLKIAADVRTFSDFDAIEWVLHITNGSTDDSPILENIQALNSTVLFDDSRVVVHSAGGTSFFPGDFAPVDNGVAPGETLKLGSANGRSSSGQTPLGRLPFFNVQGGNHGIFGAIGWSGSWAATFTRDKAGKTLNLTAGFWKTHLLLHAGETIRTPRVLLLNWHGADWRDSQNTWRRLALAYYSIKDVNGHALMAPVCCCSGGDELISSKLATVQYVHDNKIPVDLYWIDAGWYGPEKVPSGKTVDDNPPWANYRGDWYVSKDDYPNGMKPLGELLKKYHIGFLLWFEIESANAGTQFPTQHPDWYLKCPEDPQHLLLNLGNPAALKGATDYISKMITDSGLTWYRVDSNVLQLPFWNAADTPDRIGMTEINYITGLYKLWDDLRALHPGLQIDNCAGGGSRLDLETISRSFALHRSDCNGTPIVEQSHTQGLIPWIPINNGIAGYATTSNCSQLYKTRSGYSAGVNYGVNPKDLALGFAGDSGKKGLEEFREVRPYFYGDFYALTPFDYVNQDIWTIWQLDRPDLKSGLVIILRRAESLYSGLALRNLHGIDPNAQYQVEIRYGLDKGSVKQMSGHDLSQLQVTILDKPGSALVFYRKR